MDSAREGERTAPVYLDHAATTPMLPAAAAAFAEQAQRVGNASSLHASGRAARRVVEESRELIAACLGARPGEVVFTSGGTESDNLAVKGGYAARQADRPRPRVLISALEHKAVLDPADWLVESAGAQTEAVPVDSRGRLDLDALGASIERDPAAVALISVMWANNEVGTLQPVGEIADLALAHGIPFHTDAVQAVGSVPVDYAASGVDALSLSGHKIGGPYGVGVLLLSRETPVAPLVHGGGQERDVRSGTLDAPGIAALAVAVEAATKAVADEGPRLAGLRDRLVAGVRAVVPDAVLNGDPVDRLPGNAHLTFPGCEGDSLLMLLDAHGIECSTGSACNAGVAQASHVLLAMGRTEEEARSSLRFSLGHTSTGADVDALVEAIGPCVERARNARSARRSR